MRKVLFLKDQAGGEVSLRNLNIDIRAYPTLQPDISKVAKVKGIAG